MELGLLPKGQWLLRRGIDQYGKECITLGFLVVNGGIWHFKFYLSELPNDLISENDLERLGIDRSDWRPIVKRPVSSPLAE